MGSVAATVSVTNLNDAFLAEEGYLKPSAVRGRSANGVADPDAMLLLVSPAFAEELGLDHLGSRLVALPDGAVLDTEVVGPLQLDFQGRRMIGSATVVPGEADIRLGRMAMAEMDLVVDPCTNALVPNPESPHLPRVWALSPQLRGPA